MPNKAYITDLTWRSIKDQEIEFPDMPHYIGVEEVPTMLRPSQRNDVLNIYVVSLAIIAKTEKDLREFAALCRKRKANIYARDGRVWLCSQSITVLVESWRSSRRAGAAKAGGDAKADNAEKRFWQQWETIKERWHLPAKRENASQPLLAEADLSRNTVKYYLGHTREEWQRLTDAQRERILKRKKGNAKN